MTITFTVGDVPWIVIANEPIVYCSSWGGVPILCLRDAANVTKEGSVGALSYSTGNTYGSIPQVIEKITIPGTYTRKMSIQNAGPGVLTVGYTGTTVLYTAHLIARPLF